MSLLSGLSIKDGDARVTIDWQGHNSCCWFGSRLRACNTGAQT